mgnify:CR=1 FL=1
MTIEKPRTQKLKLEEAARTAINLAIEGHPDVVSYTSPPNWARGVYFEVRITRRTLVVKIP